ncbi:MAG: DHH family phosphoesterase [Oscillospiraceae bacterium]|nr:DHH family phosphoesterase [Oscillospiraceae bacterium]
MKKNDITRINKIKNLILSSDSVLVVGHKDMDTDCFGSAMGINTICNYLKKECKIQIESVNESLVPIYNRFKALNEYENVFIDNNTAKKYINKNTLIIIVDVHAKSYVENIDLIERHSNKIILDHHIENKYNKIDDVVFEIILDYYSSASEFIGEIMKNLLIDFPISKMVAEVLIAGIALDTKGFWYRTDSYTFSILSYLTSFGVDMLKIKSMFSEDFDEYNLKTGIISKAYIQDNIALVLLPNSVKDKLMLSLVVDDLLNINGINVSFGLMKLGDDVFISARSLYDFNVQYIMESLGGGGHYQMAAARLENIELIDAQIILEKKIIEYIGGQKK